MKLQIPIGNDPTQHQEYLIEIAYAAAELLKQHNFEVEIRRYIIYKPEDRPVSIDVLKRHN